VDLYNEDEPGLDHYARARRGELGIDISHCELPFYASAICHSASAAPPHLKRGNDKTSRSDIAGSRWPLWWRLLWSSTLFNIGIINFDAEQEHGALIIGANNVTRPNTYPSPPTRNDLSKQLLISVGRCTKNVNIPVHRVGCLIDLRQSPQCLLYANQLLFLANTMAQSLLANRTCIVTFGREESICSYPNFR